MSQRAEWQVLARTLECTTTQAGESLIALSEQSPVLLVFLRHAGCTFCREALGDIARARRAIEEAGAKIILVHMRDSGQIQGLMWKYGLLGVDRICDGDRQLYRAFGLKRGRLRQLFGLHVFLRGVQAAVLRGHGMGRISADGFQMPGLFLISGGGILQRFRHRTAADRPDYAGLCVGSGRRV